MNTDESRTGGMCAADAAARHRERAVQCAGWRVRSPEPQARFGRATQVRNEAGTTSRFASVGLGVSPLLRDGVNPEPEARASKSTAHPPRGAADAGAGGTGGVARGGPGRPAGSARQGRLAEAACGDWSTVGTGGCGGGTATGGGSCPTDAVVGGRPGRDAPPQNTARRKGAYLAAGGPVVTVDSKRREQAGNSSRPRAVYGTGRGRGGRPRRPELRRRRGHPPTA